MYATAFKVLSALLGIPLKAQFHSLTVTVCVRLQHVDPVQPYLGGAEKWKHCAQYSPAALKPQWLK